MRTARTRKPLAYLSARLIYKLGLDDHWGERWPMPKSDGKRDCTPAIQASFDERGYWLARTGGRYQSSHPIELPKHGYSAVDD
jgi:hypothetical protein